MKKRYAFGRAAATLVVLLGTMLPSISSAAGFDDSYFVAAGDINGDGRIDLYFKWKPEITVVPFDDFVIPIPRTRRWVAPFVLQQDSNGSFNLVTSLTPAQNSDLAQWPQVASSVSLRLADFNVDGYTDIALRDLVTVIPGALDQIVYAPAQPGAVPTVSKVIDAPLRKFFKEVYGWLINRNYFKQNAPQIPATPGRYETYLGYVDKVYRPEDGYAAAACAAYDSCEFLYGNINNPFVDPNDVDTILNGWHWWGITIVTGSSRPDYSVFDPRSLSLSGIIGDVSRPTNVIVPRGGDAERDLKAILSVVLGTEIYGGVLAGVDTYIDNEGVEIDRFLGLLMIAAALGSDPTIAPPYVNPRPNAWINKRFFDPVTQCLTADGRFGLVRNGGTKPHKGVDLGSSNIQAVVVGTELFAVTDGMVTQLTERAGAVRNPANPNQITGFGLYAQLLTQGYSFRYAHLSTSVANGQVLRGSVIGRVGRSGNISCEKTHLHFEVRNLRTGQPVDPITVSPIFTWAIEP